MQPIVIAEPIPLQVVAANGLTYSSLEIQIHGVKVSEGMSCQGSDLGAEQSCCGDDGVEGERQVVRRKKGREIPSTRAQAAPVGDVLYIPQKVLSNPVVSTGYLQPAVKTGLQFKGTVIHKGAPNILQLLLTSIPARRIRDSEKDTDNRGGNEPGEDAKDEPPISTKA